MHPRVLNMSTTKKKLLLKKKISRERKLMKRPPPVKASRPLLLEQTDDFQSLDFTCSNKLFNSLLCPAIRENAFFTDYWETQPLIIQRAGFKIGGDYSTEYGKLFSLSDLRCLVSNGCIEFGRNINVCRYVSGRREGLNGDGIVSREELDELWSVKKATFQLHQPQQFKDILWKLLSMLETYFSCLVGSNVYITPSGSQGLAPHHDDVEVFILQLEGRKHWKLYPPTQPLPETCSNDLNMEDIGDPSHDLILEAGDLMYFPRGTIHHADTPTDVTHSTHLTISTYQNHSAGNLLRQFLPTFLENLIKQDVSLRKGLPLNYLSLPGGYCNPGQQATPRHLVDTVEELTLAITKGFKETMNIVKEQYSMDFILSRLPPYHTDHTHLDPRGTTPTISDTVSLCWPDHTYLHHGNEQDDQWVYVYHSLRNDRRNHMTISSTRRPKGLKFPLNYLECLQVVFSAVRDIPVRSLPLSPNDQLTVAVTLWAEGLLTVVE